MRRSTMVVVLLTFLLSACATAAPPLATDAPTLTLTPDAVTLDTVAPDNAASPKGDTSTPQPPTATPTLSTPTRTPLPTILTFTPTFNAWTIITATSAPKAMCPKENVNIVPPDFSNEFYNNSFPDIKIKILEYLNSGGNAEGVFSAVRKAAVGGGLDTISNTKIDLTNDGVAEITSNESSLYVFGCQNGMYAVLLEVQRMGCTSPKIISVKDLNKDGVPELITRQNGGCGTRDDVHFQIFEWDGSKFQSLVQPIDFRSPMLNGGIEEQALYTEGGAKNRSGIGVYEIKDIDGNRFSEIVLDGGISTFPWDFQKNGPWRSAKNIFGWNGKYFGLIRTVIEKPEYRFQAVQDGDYYSAGGYFGDALKNYELAISSQTLLAWSPEYFRTNQETNPYYSQTPTPTLPAPDPTEYPRLAAYAYYRMIILHTFLGEMESAQVKYATLQEKFPAGNPGHSYVEMASAFWDAYQSSGSMYDACGAAIQHAAEHPGILTPLGSDYHGAQSHTYVPADVCPFR